MSFYNTMKNENRPNYAIPLAFVGIMFFSIGFALGINSFLIPVINNALGVSSGESYLVLAATFCTFILFGYPASATISKIGYKKTMALSFLMFAAGFAMYIISAKTESFLMFLAASFISGTGNTFLQASVNPYVTILGPIESGAKRISIMGICNKLAWPVAPMVLGFIIGSDADKVTMAQLDKPFYIIIVVFLILGLLALLAPLPEVKAEGETEESDTAVRTKDSIANYPHLILGAIALFFYVGVETVSLSTGVDYATSLGLKNPQAYAWISSIGMVIGYICGIILIPKYISQSKALKICSWTAVIGTIALITVPGQFSIWFLGLLALGCSLMWPAIWPLAMADLGNFTKKGSSLLVMAIAGGAVIPPLFGYLKDILPNDQLAYSICLPCYLFIMYYAYAGYKIRKRK